MKRDSANTHLVEAARGLQGRWAARKSSSTMPSASPEVPAPHLLYCQAAHVGMAPCLTPALLAAAWQEQAIGMDASTPSDVAGEVTAISNHRAGDKADPSDGLCSRHPPLAAPQGRTTTAMVVADGG